METLKVGDKVYNQLSPRWRDDIYYKFATVERLTKTQAILSDGTKLINEPLEDFYIKKVGFCVYGDRYTKWRFVTEEIIEKAKAEKEKQTINNWFSNKKFTNEEKKIIYNTLKERDLDVK